MNMTPEQRRSKAGQAVLAATNAEDRGFGRYLERNAGEKKAGDGVGPKPARASQRATGSQRDRGFGRYLTSGRETDS